MVEENMKNPFPIGHNEFGEVKVMGDEIIRLATELKHEIHYVIDVLETSMHSWADQKIGDARFYSRVQNAINELKKICEDDENSK